MVVTAGSVVLAAAPAAATTCNPWFTAQDIANEDSADCRSTFLVDPGRGNQLSRNQLLDAAGYYGTQGFSRQWLWYAPMTNVHVANTDTQQ